MKKKTTFGRKEKKSQPIISFDATITFKQMRNCSQHKPAIKWIHHNQLYLLSWTLDQTLRCAKNYNPHSKAFEMSCDTVKTVTTEWKKKTTHNNSDLAQSQTSQWNCCKNKNKPGYGRSMEAPVSIKVHIIKGNSRQVQVTAALHLWRLQERFSKMICMTTKKRKTSRPGWGRQFSIFLMSLRKSEERWRQHHILGFSHKRKQQWHQTSRIR